MNPNTFKSLISEILNEIFADDIDLNTIEKGSNITILFQDNKVLLQKYDKNMVVVMGVNNDGKIKKGDVLKFLSPIIKIGTKPQCFIYRKNEQGKILKINTIHEFSFIQKIDIA